MVLFILNTFGGCLIVSMPFYDVLSVPSGWLLFLPRARAGRKTFIKVLRSAASEARLGPFSGWLLDRSGHWEGDTRSRFQQNADWLLPSRWIRDSAIVAVPVCRPYTNHRNGFQIAASITQLIKPNCALCSTSVASLTQFCVVHLCNVTYTFALLHISYLATNSSLVKMKWLIIDFASCVTPK